MKILRTKSKKKKPAQPPEITAADLPEHAGTSLRDKLLGAVILLAALAAFVLLTLFLCRPLFTITTNPDRFGRFIREQGALGRVAFLGIQILQGFLPIPLELTTVAGGYAFGRVQGSISPLPPPCFRPQRSFMLQRCSGASCSICFSRRRSKRKYGISAMKKCVPPSLSLFF